MLNHLSHLRLGISTDLVVWNWRAFIRRKQIVKWLHLYQMKNDSYWSYNLFFASAICNNVTTETSSATKCMLMKPHLNYRRKFNQNKKKASFSWFSCNNFLFNSNAIISPVWQGSQWEDVQSPPEQHKDEAPDDQGRLEPGEQKRMLNLEEDWQRFKGSWAMYPFKKGLLDLKHLRQELKVLYLCGKGPKLWHSTVVELIYRNQ